MKNTKDWLNIVGFSTIYLLVFVYVLFKVLNVPITHDEVATTVHYSNYSAWEIMMYPDPWPNNHILNTLLTKFSISIFGAEQWSVRLPNLLSFGLYAWGAFSILKTVLSTKSSFFIPGALLLVLSPYMLDFFSLCRGYGMSLGFCCLSVAQLLIGFKNRNNKNIWWSLVLAILASYANFTLLVFWASITLMCAFYFFVRFKEGQKLVENWGLIFLVSLGYLALIFQPISKMQGTNQFEYWTNNGFFTETILPLVQYSKYDSRIFLTAEFLSWFAVALLFLNLGFIIWKWQKNQFNWKELTKPISLSTLVLFFTAGISILQSSILDTPNLHGRTALFFFPLFMIMLICARELFPNGDSKHLKKIFSVLLSGLFLHHIGHTMKPYSVKEWEYDANTLKVIDFIQNDKSSETISLATDWMFNPSFQFYVYTKKYSDINLMPYNKEIDVALKSDYYYIFQDDFERLSPEYDIIQEYENGALLMKRGKH